MNEQEQFMTALRRLPKPIPCFANGAACPWCGALHQTVTFGRNQCDECDHTFSFGYPEGYEGKDPLSYVPFPWREWYAMGERADLIEDWSPNKRLRQIYFKQAEETLGIHADLSTPN